MHKIPFQDHRGLSWIFRVSRNKILNLLKRSHQCEERSFEFLKSRRWGTLYPKENLNFLGSYFGFLQ